MGDSKEREVTISLDEYAELQAVAERVATLSRWLHDNKYANMGDVCTILCIEMPEEEG